MSKKISRRKFARSAAVGTGSIVALSYAPERARASDGDNDTWNWEDKANVYPYEHHISVCLEHLQTTYYEDEDYYEYKFNISSDGVSHDGSENERRDLSRSFIKFKKGDTVCDNNITTYYTPDKKVTGFYPKDDDNDEALEEVTQALDTAVSVINAKYAWASGAASIAENLINVLTVSNDEEWDKIFRRIYDKRYAEVSHHTKIIIEYDNNCQNDRYQAEQVVRCQIGSAIVEFKIIIDDNSYGSPQISAKRTNS